MPDNKEKMLFAKFIDFLEKNDPSGLSQAYYQTLIGKYEKTLANDGFVEADKKALEYIKKNDPTGFVRHYYEQTNLGIREAGFIKAFDARLDILDKAADKTYKAAGVYLKDGLYEIATDLKKLIMGDNQPDNNKNLPSVKEGDLLNRNPNKSKKLDIPM